jgi:Xaa-Pro aminopeptidase
MAAPDRRDEELRVLDLVEAQRKAQQLFAEVEARELVTPGAGEQEVSNQIRDLANDLYGTTKHWHKRIVRSGPHTLFPYRENPPDRIIGEDDIAFADFGPIFEEYEADFGRTFVLGDDPAKHRLKADLATVFAGGRQAFRDNDRITGRQLYAEVQRLAASAGWSLGGWHAGHLIGEFPHETIRGSKEESYITPENGHPLRRTDRAGWTCHWILEIHLVDEQRQFGGFFEQLLDLA